jgi:hypothetical protein
MKTRGTIDNSAHHHTPAVTSVREAFALARKAIKFCLLCRTTNLHYLGSFTPHVPQLWFDHVRPNATRVRWYGLCKPCADKKHRGEGSPGGRGDAGEQRPHGARAEPLTNGSAHTSTHPKVSCHRGRGASPPVPIWPDQADH